MKIPEVATGGVLRKKVFFKMSQNSQETLVPEETPVNFATFLRTLFSQYSSGRLFLKYGHCNNERYGLSLLQRAGCNALLLWLKSQSAREASHHPAFMGICPTISHMYEPYLADHLIDEFFFWFLV